MAIKWPRLRRRSPHAATSPRLPSITSPTFETHVGPIDLEEASKRSIKAKGPQNLSMAWDDSYTGVPGVLTRDGLLSERDKKDTYYKAYIGNPWVRACVQSIAKRFTSGKWEVEQVTQGEGDEADRDRIKQLLLYVNEDEDFKQFLRSVAESLLIYGESFAEIVYQNGVPVQLHTIDAVTMTTQFDRHGMVVKYVQNLEKATDVVEFEPDQVIRWWLPDPRASKKALSPIECIKDSVYLYQSMITWAEKFFKQGARPSFSIEMGPDSQIDDANRYVKFFKENYMGINNAHVPPVLYSGAKLIESGKGSVEMEFLKGLSWARDEILAGYNVPLNVTGIQETAHLGGGSGESANKIFVYNTVMPVEQLIMEKLNYRLVQRAFRMTAWMVTVSHADYRDDEQISKVQDTQIRNGSLTVNEARQERGRLPVKGGDTGVIVASRDIVPVERLDDLAEEQRQQAQTSLQGAHVALQQQGNAQQQQGGQQGNEQNAQQPQQAAQGKKDAGKDTAQSSKESTPAQPAHDRTYAPVTTSSSESRDARYVEIGANAAGVTLQEVKTPLHDALQACIRTQREAELVSYWQDSDPDIQKQLAQMRQRGVTHLTWQAHKNCCDSCVLNDKETRAIGERFPSGAYTIPNHGNCECSVKEIIA